MTVMTVMSHNVSSIWTNPLPQKTGKQKTVHLKGHIIKKTSH